jgi:GTP 3',8-cyclase
MEINQTKGTPSNLLVDQFSRTISYLRLSITDRCNLRCMYCMPASDDGSGGHIKSAEVLQHQDLLTYEELLRFVTIAVSLGMTKIRLTGGEPLIRRGIMGFIRDLGHINKLEQIRLTTNGILLQEKAKLLYQAGIRQLNISLDSLRPERFARITGKDLFAQVWRGIETAITLGFHIKLNVVAMKGINDDEFADFAGLALEQPIQVRFIECMPIGAQSGKRRNLFIPVADIQSILLQSSKLFPMEGRGSEGPARVFRITDRKERQGSVGFISPISHHFCDSCNRLRLTSEGRLRSCLLSDRETDIRGMIRGGCSDDELIEAIRATIHNKQKGHNLHQGLDGLSEAPCRGRMSRIGG